MCKPSLHAVGWKGCGTDPPSHASLAAPSTAWTLPRALSPGGTHKLYKTEQIRGNILVQYCGKKGWWDHGCISREERLGKGLYLPYGFAEMDAGTAAPAHLSNNAQSRNEDLDSVQGSGTKINNREQNGLLCPPWIAKALTLLKREVTLYFLLRRIQWAF